MQRQNYIFLFLICIVHLQCTKEKHKFEMDGTVAYNDKHHTPAKGARIELYVHYETGVHNSDFVGEATTNDEGNYKITGEINIPNNSYNGFNIRVTEEYRAYWPFYNSNEKLYYEDTFKPDISALNTKSTKDVILNGIDFMKFHIKNTAPVDSNDVLNYISFNSYASDNFNPFQLNLHGSQLDTTLFMTRISELDQSKPDYVIYFFNFTKGGNEVTTAKDSVLISPFDTLNIFFNY